MENVSIPEIDDAAADYVDARDNRMRLLREELETSGKLLQLMRDRKLDAYEYDGFVVQVLSQTKVKVKRAKEEEGEGGHE